MALLFDNSLIGDIPFDDLARFDEDFKFFDYSGSFGNVSMIGSSCNFFNTFVIQYTIYIIHACANIRYIGIHNCKPIMGIYRL